jgi:hypothetical protein
MTLYEEVGLRRGATAGEIRHAYHNLVRLLHPDSIQDPEVRHLAETQLRRLNSVFEVLNEPARRAAYDASLDGNAPGQLPARVAPVWTKQAASPYWGAAGLALLLVVAAGLVTSQSQLPAQAVEGAESVPASQAEPQQAPKRASIPLVAETRELAAEVQQLRRELERRARAQAPETMERGQPREGEPGGEAVLNASATPPAFRMPELAQVAQPAFINGAAPAARAPAPPTILGTWLYAQRPHDTARPDWYPPDFIELKVQALGGGIAGRYQARYRVGDKLVSPEIRFRFEGRAPAARDGTGETYVWTASDGARGEVRLRQTSPLTLQVEWATTQKGGVPSLLSGTALLVRSPE